MWFVELFLVRQRLSNVVEVQAEKINDLNYGMIEALSTAIEFRSAESGNHVRRIHDITRYLLFHTELGAFRRRNRTDCIGFDYARHWKDCRSGCHFE